MSAWEPFFDDVVRDAKVFDRARSKGAPPDGGASDGEADGRENVGWDGERLGEASYDWECEETGTISLCWLWLVTLSPDGGCVGTGD